MWSFSGHHTYWDYTPCRTWSFFTNWTNACGRAAWRWAAPSAESTAVGWARSLRFRTAVLSEHLAPQGGSPCKYRFGDTGVGGARVDDGHRSVGDGGNSKRQRGLHEDLRSAGVGRFFDRVPKALRAVRLFWRRCFPQRHFLFEATVNLFLG